MLRRLLIALEMRHLPSHRNAALPYLLGRYPLSRWEEELILSPRLPLLPGPVGVSGVRGESECPASHWDQEGEPCFWCGAQT